MRCKYTASPGASEMGESLITCCAKAAFDIDCRQQRFLLWTRNMVDYDAGHSHTSFAYHCAFWEAYSLNRTLVLDSFAGMGREWDIAAALKPAYRFGFQVCHPKKRKVEKNTFHEPADLNFTMPKEYRYPTLDYDTSPDGIHKTIEPYVPHGSTLYIATNERDPVTFFKPLEQYYTVLSLAHFPEFLHFENFLPSTLALIDYAVLVSTACDMSIPTFASELSRGFPEYISLSQLLK
ncbi:hypothetical protein JKP88DRAFT_349740 [Tribonema minus]|uniref:Uncharacterized protein n=1 Tax=Tribonema minus TaxID=303371 RepID=A0A835YST0_9STRA|nr:hypothetical protein JKP88DRAFT_349740 [Tribonema minus]